MEINYHGPVVAFDLDDTLFRERDFCRSGFRFLCGEDIELAAQMERELVARRNPFVPFENKFGPVNESGILEAYRNHKPDSLLLAEGVRETLDYLADKGIRIAIITDGRASTQRRKIEALGLDKYVSPHLILISEETGHEKLRSKEMFATVVREFPEAAAFYYVGNNPLKDFYYPNLLGWTTMQVPPHPDDVHPPCEPPTSLHAPLVRLDSFGEIISFL